MDQKTVHNTVKKIVVDEGKTLIDNWHQVKITKIKGREKADITTNLDKAIEKSLVNKLLKAFPKTGFQLEEHPELEKKATYQWIIDPIDGTKYYASKIPLFCVSIGLTKNNNPIYGAIYNPVSKHLYTGGTNIPAQLNGTPIKVSPITTLEKTMLSVDFGKATSEKGQKWTMNKINNLTNTVYRIRMFGSGALSLAWVASNSRLNAYITLSSTVKFVDIAAGLAICQAAEAHIEIMPHPINTNKKLYIVGTQPIVQKIKKIIAS